jgi:hypothetical protein
MAQESTAGAWDLRPVITEPLSLKVYLLFLLVVFIFTTLRLVGVWVIVAPFRRRPPAGNPAYCGVLRAGAASLQHWSSLYRFGDFCLNHRLPHL